MGKVVMDHLNCCDKFQVLQSIFNILDWKFLEHLIVSCSFNIIDINDRRSYANESNIVDKDSSNETMIPSLDAFGYYVCACDEWIITELEF